MGNRGYLYGYFGKNKSATTCVNSFNHHNVPMTMVIIVHVRKQSQYRGDKTEEPQY